MTTRENDLTGVWDGLYSYTLSAQLESCFTAVLLQTGGGFSGMIHETMRRHMGDVAANAAVEGMLDGKAVRFTKAYDGSGGQSHSVLYEGRLSGDEIEGVWSVPQDGRRNTGRFLMIRGRKAETGAETGILEKV